MSAKFSGFIIFCVGLLFTIPALLQFVPMYLFVQQAQFVKASITGTVAKDKLFAPTLQFTTQKGESIEFTSNVYSKTAHKVGDQLTVFYDKANPKNAMVYIWGDVWGLPIFFSGLGIPFLFVGILMLIRSIGQRAYSQHTQPSTWR